MVISKSVNRDISSLTVLAHFPTGSYYPPDCKDCPYPAYPRINTAAYSVIVRTSHVYKYSTGPYTAPCKGVSFDISNTKGDINAVLDVLWEVCCQNTHPYDAILLFLFAIALILTSLENYTATCTAILLEWSYCTNLKQENCLTLGTLGMLNLDICTSLLKLLRYILPKPKMFDKFRDFSRKFGQGANLDFIKLRGSATFSK